MKTKSYTCIICPNGCDITVQFSDEAISDISGNLCPKGIDYVRNEIESPKRTIASSVAVLGGISPLASVRLSDPVPKHEIQKIMDIIKKISLTAPVSSGDIIIENIAGTNSTLIATSDCPQK